MNILVIGGGGFIGQRIARELAFRGALRGKKIDRLVLADINAPALVDAPFPVETCICDITDRASVETDRALELRTRDRARKLISKINQALLRIENGSYGFCEETGEPIGLKRLEARPIATLSIEAQERHERMEKIHRDD